MKLPILLLGALLLASCESGDGFPPAELKDGPVDTVEAYGGVRKGYNEYRSGVQIAMIQYNQTNPVGDEWVTLRMSGSRSLAGWHLDAGDSTQSYLLTSNISDSLVIYTHEDKNLIGIRDTGLALSASKFIWSNSTPDTAFLYDDKGVLIDWLTYTAK
jgi:hypothetical protein